MSLRFGRAPRGGWWDHDVIDYRADVFDDLERRMLIPPNDDDEPVFIGTREAALQHRLQRLWLFWRDEEIRAGATSPRELRARLLPRRDAWLAEPMAELDGRTPGDVIAEERAEAAEQSEAMARAMGRLG